MSEGFHGNKILLTHLIVEKKRVQSGIEKKAR